MNLTPQEREYVLEGSWCQWCLDVMDGRPGHPRSCVSCKADKELARGNHSPTPTLDEWVAKHAQSLSDDFQTHIEVMTTPELSGETQADLLRLLMISVREHYGSVDKLKPLPSDTSVLSELPGDDNE